MKQTNERMTKVFEQAVAEADAAYDAEETYEEAVDAYYERMQCFALEALQEKHEQVRQEIIASVGAQEFLTGSWPELNALAAKMVGIAMLQPMSRHEVEEMATA